MCARISRSVRRIVAEWWIIMKRFVCTILAMIMTFSLMACSANETSEAQTEQSSDTEVVEEFLHEEDSVYSDAEAPTGYKIGFAYLPPSDTLSAAFRKVLDYTAAEFGCEMVYGEFSSGSDLETQLSTYQNMIQAGAQGIIGFSISGGLIDIFNEGEVWWCGVTQPLDDAVREMALESPWYCGNICEDNELEGYNIARCLYDAGCRNIGAIGLAPGTSLAHDERFRGIKRFVEEHPDMVLVAESNDLINPTVFDEFIAAHGTKIDGIACTGGNAALPAAILAAGYSDSIKYATVDIQGDVRTDLADGLCVGVGCGQFPSMQLGFVLVYNALSTNGKHIIDLETTLPRQTLWVTSAEEYDNYVTYVEGTVPPYTGDELKSLCLAYNSDKTQEDLTKLLAEYCDQYSLEDIVARHSGLVG